MNKIIVLLLIMVMSTFVLSPSIFAEGSSYQSESSIIFKKADDELDSDGSSHIPGGELDTESSADGSVDPINGDRDTLPKTTTNMYSILLLGFILLVIGILVLLYINRKNKNNLTKE